MSTKDTPSLENPDEVLKGKTVIVTAGNQGGGACIALRFAASSANVVVIANKSQFLDKTHVNDVAYQIIKELFRAKLMWRERLNFILEDDFSIKRIQFTDLIQEEAEEVSTETTVDQFDAEFVLCSGEFAAFLPAVLVALEGVEEKAKASKSAKDSVVLV